MKMGSVLHHTRLRKDAEQTMKCTKMRPKKMSMGKWELKKHVKTSIILTIHF